GTSAQSLAALRETDALCVVLRAFGPDADPARELEEIRTELILADLAVTESALASAERRAKGGRTAVPEFDALGRAHAALSDERLLAEAGLDVEDAGHLRAIAPLTLKPWVPVANLEEGAELPGDSRTGPWPCTRRSRRRRPPWRRARPASSWPSSVWPSPGSTG